MTAVTFQTLYERIEREVLKQTGTSYQADVKNAIVTAIRFCEAEPVWFTEKVGSDLTLNASSNNVSLPSDFSRMMDLRIVVSGSVRGKDTGFAPVGNLSELRAKAGATTRADAPAYWCLVNNKIYVDTTPDDSYTLKIDYNCKDAAYPSSGSDTSIWFDEGQDVIRWHAMGIFYGDRLHDEVNEAKYFARAQAALAKLTGRSNTRESSYRVE